ncbi:MAG TPA: OmpA family protein [Labilithrix sp.]|nr:OmpA family protein [Labilithrix sp.]
MKCRLSIPVLSLALVALAAASGCDSPGLSRKAKAPASPGAQGVGEATTTGASLSDQDGQAGAANVETAGLSISGEIARACGITARADGKAAAPSFDFDSAALAPEDRTMLAQVAKCLADGALRGRSVSLVGRTDPRGEPEYNMTLGGSRADTVHRYMVDLGVGRERLSTTSRGEMDATGTSEAGWAQDRRVDIELVKK